MSAFHAEKTGEDLRTSIQKPILKLRAASLREKECLPASVFHKCLEVMKSKPKR